MSTYSCPHCNVALNVNGYLVLSVKNSAGNFGIVLLSDKLGDYNVHYHPSLHFEKGENAYFRCPGCRGELTYMGDQELVRIFLKDDNGEESTVIFSAIYGENSTYQISEQRRKTYGEMIAKFKDPDWYLKVREEDKV